MNAKGNCPKCGLRLVWKARCVYCHWRKVYLKKNLDNDLIELLIKYQGVEGEPFLGVIRRYIHKRGVSELVPLMEGT